MTQTMKMVFSSQEHIVWPQTHARTHTYMPECRQVYKHYVINTLSLSFSLSKWHMTCFPAKRLFHHVALWFTDMKVEERRWSITKVPVWEGWLSQRSHTNTNRFPTELSRFKIRSFLPVRQRPFKHRHVLHGKSLRTDEPRYFYNKVYL